LTVFYSLRLFESVIEANCIIL